MTRNISPSELVQLIRERVVDHPMSEMVETLRTASLTGLGDYWAAAIELFRSLPPEDQAVLISMLRQTAIDTVASVLYVVDGGQTDSDKYNEFELRCQDGEKLSDDLTDLFLAYYQQH